MSSKYKTGEDAIPHFITFTVVGWIDVFSRECYKELLVKSLQYCIENKGLQLHAWVIMTNHVHLIVSSNTNKIADIVRDIKKYSSKQIIKAIQDNPAESRKEWMLNIFGFVGQNNNNNKEFQFWKQDYHPIELNTHEKLQQRLNYLHENPVRSGLVWEPWQYKYSSATDYYTTESGLIKIEPV
ncbi:REP-associated tyrosine transposase [Ferruginibacter sp.]|nr:transposase [Ferruginibacter sp.]